MTNMWTEATWQKGKRIIKGRWQYYRPSDKFFIEIDKADGVSGSRTRNFEVYGDTPEWNGWKRVKK